MKIKLNVKYEKEIESPWNFSCPVYDNRSGCSISAGTNYGVGKKTPTGTYSNKRSSPIPMGRIDTKKVGYIHKGSVEEYEIVEE
jgi:hypothetical protein